MIGYKIKFEYEFSNKQDGYGQINHLISFSQNNFEHKKKKKIPRGTEMKTKFQYGDQKCKLAKRSTF